MKLGSIGFVGLGIMGKGMLNNLITNIDCNSFVIWNRNSAVCNDFKTQFPDKISVAETAADVVRQCDVTYTMLSNLDASTAVYDQPEHGIIAGVSEGKVIVDCATLSPERMIAESDAITAKGGLFMEAPVSGSKVPAEQGSLIFLCGGDERVFEQTAAALDAMGKARYYFGAAGKGSEVKIVVNMIMGTMMSALSEGMALGRESDLPLDTLLQVLDIGAMSNPMFRMKGANIIADSHQPNFPLKHAQKDMQLGIDLGRKKGVALPTSAAANDLMKTAIHSHNCGDEDFSAVYKAL